MAQTRTIEAIAIDGPKTTESGVAKEPSLLFTRQVDQQTAARHAAF